MPAVDKRIQELKAILLTGAQTEGEREQSQEELQELETQKEDIYEHLAHGATVRARQE